MSSKEMGGTVDEQIVMLTRRDFMVYILEIRHI